MEQQTIAGGGVQFIPQIAAVQYIYLDFDGDLTAYRGEILTVDNVEVKDSSLTEERIDNIIAELNAKYASQNVVFVNAIPEDADYSTIYIGRTEAFAEYGNFAGLAETIDFDNKNKTDKAFVMLDSTASNEAIIATIFHETAHLLGTLNHGGEGLQAYAARYDVTSGVTSTGIDLSNDSMYISSGGTANSTTVNDRGSMYIYSSGVANSTTVNSAGRIYISSGGTANSTTVNDWGEMYISSGGTANCTTVNSRGEMYISSGGTANSTTVNSGGYIDIYSGGTANCTTVNSSGYIYIASGGAANSTTVNGYGSMYISSGGAANSTTVNGYGSMHISSGGTANSTTVNSGGYMRISSGGTANSTTVNSAGRIYISSGGVANSTTVNSSGYMHIYSGGTANSTTVNDLGDMYISSGGTANSTTVNSRGYMYISSGGSAADLSLKAGGELGGFSFAEDKYFADITDGSAAISDNVHIVRNNMNISSGGTANSTTVNSGGSMYIESGGVANCTTVNSSGYMYISSGGTANNTTVNSSGYMWISSGGTAADIIAAEGAILGIRVASDTYIQGTYAGSAFEMKDAQITGYTVNDGGVMYIESGGTANSTTVNMYGSMRISSGGVANSTTVNYVGEMYIKSGGTANSTTVSSGYMCIYSGGVANCTVLSGGTIYYDSATMNIGSGGTANSTTVNSYGSMHISSGGVANSTTVNGYGSMYIDSGGKHRGSLQIESGTVISAYEGSVIDFTVAESTVEDDYLINDLSLISGVPTYTITVSADQAFGEYKLAQGAENFTGSITIGDYSVEYGSITVNGEDFIYADKVYNLDQVDGNLTLNIDIVDVIAPDKPVAAADITTLTNQNVTVTAEFSDDSLLKEYSLDGKNWQSYTAGVVLAENAAVYFRGIDAAGNVSETTEYEVNNIDKAAPEIPGGFTETVSKQSVTITWDDAIDSGIAGIKGYEIRYGNTSNLSGKGEFISTAGKTISALEYGTYYYQVQALDNLGNVSGWSEVRSWTMEKLKPVNLQSTGNSVSWNKINVAAGYVVEISPNEFKNSIILEISGNKLDISELSFNSKWRVRVIDEDDWSYGDTLKNNAAAGSGKIVSNADGNMDIFFANASGYWQDLFYARHDGSLNGWKGTQELVELSGKNKLSSVWQGSDDANILLLSDSGNGDALFVDDVYTEFGKNAARISQIDEIRAGLGDDVVDMTSRQFAYVGNGVKIYGGAGNDTIWANNGSNTLSGDAGNDRIIGGKDDDVIIGGSGNDSMHGGGGSDIFSFGGAWGNDIVEQLADGEVTLWFENGSAGNWNAGTLTYTDGANSVKVSGVTADKINLKFGGDATALPTGAFADAASEKIFEDQNKGFLA